ncbi:unnamed protein product [Schistosoma intercalatum]|nr:unnamed protein product [Schistosoma intercalatum]
MFLCKLLQFLTSSLLLQQYSCLKQSRLPRPGNSIMSPQSSLTFSHDTKLLILRYPLFDSYFHLDKCS